MKNALRCMGSRLLPLPAMAGSALTASFSGRIWTGKPIGGRGGMGYYCTAAQNTSPNSVNPVAHAEAYRNGAPAGQKHRPQQQAVRGKLREHEQAHIRLRLL